MMKKFSIAFLTIYLISVFSVSADEGMWIPMLLKKYNEADMIKKGLKITADDIYSINHNSLKDAIVLFGRGCTAEVVSDQGLLLTNHHCGFGQIQQHSSVEHDYLTKGFWAMNASQELPNPGLTVKFLIRMDDVTTRVLDGVDEEMTEIQRQRKIAENSKKIISDETEGTHYIAEIKSLYYGNQYFIYIMEEYKDVRLVGAPPSAIGKFGGDTDNWMWPRHTGDFSVFRIYADKDGNPAEYSPDNVPLKPKMHFKISLKGVQKNDFTMVYGYPYTTQEYLPSYDVENIMNFDRPTRIMLRQQRLDIMREEMEKDPAIRIKYADKYAGVANGWKKWQGEIKGLKRLNALEKKQTFEEELSAWIDADAKRTELYADILPALQELQQNYADVEQWTTWFFESLWGVDAIRYARKYLAVYSLEKNNKEKGEKYFESFRKGLTGNYKDYYAPIDQKLLARMLEAFYEGVPENMHPDIYKLIKEKFNGDFDAFAKYAFEESIFASKERMQHYLEKYSYGKTKKLKKDPVMMVTWSFLSYYRDHIQSQLREKDVAKKALMRRYMKAQMEYAGDKLMYPDANATLRLTYGKIDNYLPADGVVYRYYTTLNGIIEKDNPEVYDYDVPDKLKVLQTEKDYGRYGENGELHVAFTASNHTSGGNSGSPVLNANGELIGINFDRNWEGTMSDIMYDPDMCRNISLDIRYCLFIIDKFAGAGHLVEEMDIVE